MGACAGCMGPSRRDENYRVNRLTENAVIKSRVSTAQLPSFNHQKKIVSQLNQQKRRIDQSSLLGVLVNSPQINQSYPKQTKLSNSQFYRDPNQSPYKQNQQNSSMVLPKSIRRIDSSPLFDNSMGIQSSVVFSNDKAFQIQNKNPMVSDFRIPQFSRQSSKIPLSQLTSNRNAPELSLPLKKKGLLGIPQISQQESKTPLYVKQMRKQNGEDVLKTGLACMPTKLQSAPNANLYKYLQDLL